MAEQTRIPQHTSDLRVTHETSVAEVREYLATRLAEPAVVEGSVVWNFNSHDLDASALLDAADQLDQPAYVVSYQVSGTWGVMVELLPDFVADADLLTYQSQQGRYEVYDNLRAADSDLQTYAETHHARHELAQQAREAVQSLDAEVSL